MKTLRRHRFAVNALLTALVVLWQVGQPLQAATYYWDADGSAAGNDPSGTNLGGAGSWNGPTNWWDGAANMAAWPNTDADGAIFTGPILLPATPFQVTLGNGTIANRLSFLRSGFTLAGGDLTLAGAAPTLHANFGETATISTQILGIDGLTMTGGGAIRLTNNANSYTGVTTINNGLIIIGSQAALGDDTSSIVVNGSATRGFGGGALLLQGGYSSGVVLSRGASLQGLGPIGANAVALISVGSNSITGLLSNGPATVNTAVSSASGRLTLADVTVGGTTNSTFMGFGSGNSTGVGSYAITGVLSGAGSIQKLGGGTLILSPSDASGFTGTVRVSGGSVRIRSAADLGSNVGSGSSSPIYFGLDGAVLEVRSDTPAIGKNMFQVGGASSILFVDHAIGSSVINSTATFGSLTYDDGETLTFNGRNGYGVSVGAAPVVTGDGNSAFANNIGGLLTFTGNFWSNANNTASRSMTISGNGNTVINGNVVAAAAAYNHTLAKTGTGLLTITGTGSTLDGAVSVQGSLGITDFRSITNNTETITLGNTTTTAGNLIIGTSVAPTATGLMTSRPIVFNTTTASNAIYANQAGVNPVVLNGAITKPNATTASVILGGTNTADNVINVGIPSNGTGGLNKTGPGTWVLAAPNAYTGVTTIQNGTLKLKANAATSTILPSANDITFGTSTGYAGATLEIVGQNGVTNVQALDVLSSSFGANTIKLTPGVGGSVSLSFASQSTSAGGSINIVGADFVTNRVSITGADGLISRTNYWEGADFAYRKSNVLRAPVYGTDSGFVTSATALAAGNNEVTGSFAANSISVNTLKFNGGHTLTINDGQTVTLSNGGVLATGGASTITGGSALAMAGGQAFVARVNLPTDSLTIGSVITGDTGLTKNGAGTLILTAANNQTGTITLNEGTIQLSGSGRLGAAAALTIRQGTTLDLNGVTPATNTNAFNSYGTVTNSSATAVTFSIGGADGTGTSRGIIQNGNGVVNVTKIGNGAQSWLGNSTYTGITTIGGSTAGLVTVDTLANIGEDSGIGRGDTGNNAGSLVFNGAGGGLVYAGVLRNGELTVGSTSAESNRLFTLSGTGATLSSTATNNNAVVFSNPGAIVYGVTGPQLLTLTGTSTGDNTLFPQITDSGSGANITSVSKTGTGKWVLGNANNTYSGPTTVVDGILELKTAGSLPGSSGLLLGATTTSGTLETSGDFVRNLATAALAGANTVSWNGTTGGGGFAASTAKLRVALGGVGTETALQWGTGGFVNAGAPLILNSTTALSEVEWRNAIDLNGADRTITVNDNTSTYTDFATITGVISNSATSAGVVKSGSGTLQLFGANTYNGTTAVTGGTLVVTSLGMSTDSAVATSVGTNIGANLPAGAVTLGNGSTGAGILQYVGTGETSDRLIRLNTTTGSTQIHADGSGPLILTNVRNDMTAGSKPLYLRGSNTQGNMITSVLADNTAGTHTLGITADGGATWILTGNNTYTGTTNITGGALGAGHNNAFGTGPVVLRNGSLFAYGADRTLANPISITTTTSGGTTVFIGNYNLNLTGAWTYSNTTTGHTITNGVAAGKAVTIAGNMALNALTENETLTINGTGDTVITGNIATSTAMNLGLTYSGTGNLTLAGTAFDLNAGNVTLSSGTLKLGAGNVINNATTGNVTMNPAAGVSAAFDLNGNSDTIRGLTASSLGTAIIDNSSTNAAMLTLGNGDQAATFIGRINNTGIGALSLTKTGTAAAVFSQGPYSHKGTTAVTGGSLTFGGDVTATSALSVTGAGSLLALTGGHSGSGSVMGVSIGAGGELNLFNGLGEPLANLTSLTLGAGSILDLNAGTTTDTLTLLAGNVASVSGAVTLNIRDTGGMAGSTTYNLLAAASGGLISGGGSAGSYTLNQIPGGFTSLTLNQTDTLVSLTTGNLVVAPLYWTGANNSVWNTVDATFQGLNWSPNKAGTPVSAFVPGAGSTVIFQADNAAGGALTTVLEQGFRINNLEFEISAATPSSVVINPGVVVTNKLTIDPINTTTADGIHLKAGGAASVTIAAPVGLGSNQTWTVADAGAILTVSGALSGSGNLIKAGAGKAIISAAADPTFGAATVTVNNGQLEIGNATALGSTIIGNAAAVAINAGGVFYYNNATSGTVSNAITLNGGTLSAGGASQTYGGLVNVSADTIINMRDSNSAALTTTQRSTTLSGVLSGAGKLTVDSINTLSGGNQLTGTLTLSNDNSGWSGGLEMLRGTVTATNVNALGSGAITGHGGGRITFNTAGGTILNLAQNITLDAAGGILEFNADASGTPVTDMTVNLTGTITLGSAANANNALRISQSSDNFSIINITNSIILGNHASISYQGSSVRPLVIGALISETGAARNLAINDELYSWGVTSQTVRLTAANTFSGNLLVNEGTLEYETVTNAGGAPSNLGQGSAITLGSGTLSFIGAASQSTNRAIGTTGSATLSANGTSGAVITYTGAITQTANNSLNLAGTGEGRITGGITQSGTSGDLNVNGGIWHLENATSVVSDDIVVSGPGTVFNLDTTGGMTFTSGASNGLHARNGAVINLNANDVNGAANSGGLDFINVGDSTTGAAGVLNTNAFTITTPGLLIGGVAPDLEGTVNGSGTITVTNTATDWSLGIRAYRGSIAANLAGVSSLLKQGLGTVTLSGNNSGLTGTVAATRLDAGNLTLDYSTDNNAKISTSAQLDMRGATLTINGNASADTTQTANGFTLSNGGSNIITMNSGAGRFATLNLGAITRSGSAGTLRVNLPGNAAITTTTANGSHGLLGGSGFATVNDGTGTWFARNDGANNIVALASTAKNEVTTWTAGDHVTDETTGYSGTLNRGNINSLRFNAAGGSHVNLTSTGVLNLASGGILVTGGVLADKPGIYGGILATGVTELIVTQDSPAVFEISSDIGVNNALTKTGGGTLLLSGNNTFTGQLQLQDGTLKLSGGNALGDSAPVTLADDHVNTLELLSDETIGRLSGGSSSTGLHTLATVAIDGHTLTINHSGSNTAYAGLFTGTGTIVKQGTHQLQLTGSSTGFTGGVVVNSGLFYLSGNGRLDASSIAVNKGAALLLDYNGSTRIGTRILDTTPIILNSADGAYQGQTIVRGLNLRSDQDDTNSETVGVVTANSGANYMSLEATSSNDDPNLTAANMVRANGATLDIRGTNLGTANTQRAQFRIGDATNQTNFISALIGGGGSAGTQNISIVPWAIGESYTGGAGDGFMGNSLVTYVSGSGFRTLDWANEYDTFTSAAVSENVRESLSADLAGLAGKTVNSLVLNNAAIATVNVTGAGAGQTMTNTSGAFLFTVTGGAASTAYTTNLGGFDAGINVGGGEYIFQVVNPSSAANTSTLIAAVGSPLTSAADITKSGRGTLILSGVNPAGGGANKTTFNEGVLEISDLDNIGGNAGGLIFAGGTLRLSGTYSGDDFSGRPITLLNGGATIDTNGNSLALANTIGSGSGGLTKVGIGTLTLNAASGYAGPTVINVGTLAVGANNATGIGGDLTINAGAILDLASYSVSAGLVTTTGASPIVTGSGTITASAGFFLNHTGNTAIAAVLAGPGGVFKAQSNTVSLAGASSYTGPTEVQDGVLSFDSIGNVGGAASALGQPANAADGMIRMGLTTASTGLTYTGTGHSSNRTIAMQGTTGGVTLNASGSGAVIFGVVTGFTPGAKTLTLGGASDPSINNTLGVIEDGVAIISVAKTNANTWEFNQANTYTGTTTVNDGILRINAGSNISAAATTITAGALDLRNGSQSIAALTMGNGPAGSTSAVLLNGGALNLGGNITIPASTTAGLATIEGGTLNFGDATRILTVNNSTATDTDLRISAGIDVGNGFGLTKAGSGKLEITTSFDLTGSTATFGVTGGITDLTGSAYVIEGNLQVGLNSTATLNYTTPGGSLSVGSGSANAVDIGVTSGGTAGGGTLNLSGLNQFTANVGSFRVGSLVTGAGTGVGSTVVTLANNNSITAATAFIMGDNGGVTSGVGSASDLRFGSGTNTVITPTITLGGRKGSPDSTTGVRVTIASGGTLILNNGLGKTDLFIGDNNIDTGTKTLSSVDLSGGSLVATLGSLIVARKSGSTSAGNSMATLTIGSSAANAITADSVIIGNYVSGTASFANGTMNFGGGSFSVANDVTLASRGAAGGNATGLLNLTGGSFTVGGNITTTNSASATATLTLDGATLDMTDGTINVDTFNARSGVLQNVAQIQNGDASTAAILSKTTPGVLTMGNGNHYTGGTQVSDGILIAANTAGSATGSGAVAVDAAGTLAGNGLIAPGVDKNITVNGNLQVGMTADGTGTAQQLTLATSGTGMSAVNGVVAFDLFSGQNFVGENGASANDRVAVAGTSGFTIGSGATLKVTTSIPIDSTWVAGASWRLFDWSALTGEVTGTFSNVQPVGAPYFSDPINLPNLDSIGLAWHFDAGVLTVVTPEPSRMLLLFVGLMGIWFRRRRAA